MSNDGFWRRLFAIAAVFNLVAGLPPLLAPAQALQAFGMAPLPEHLFVRTTSALVLTFGLGYWLVSRDLARRELVWLGIVGKLGVVVLFGHAWLRGVLPLGAAAIGFGDLLFALAFATFLVTHR
ncbi:MAG: hypothetical protein U0807_13825 [Candidatus Binatia bacterium]